MDEAGLRWRRGHLLRAGGGVGGSVGVDRGSGPGRASNQTKRVNHIRGYARSAHR
jgi:hypothetical protein